MARFDRMMVGMLIIVVGLVFCIAMVNDFDNSYDFYNSSNSEINDTFGDSFKTIDTMQNISKDIKGLTIDTDLATDEAETGAIATMTRGAYAAVRLVPQSFKLVNSLMNGIGRALGIHCLNRDDGTSITCLVIDYAYLGFIIISLFTLVYLVFRFR